MFNDRAQIHVKAGRGGDGGLSFRREKYVPKGGPDGGDGGNGGDVLLIADADLRDLSALQRRRWIEATKGGNGRGARKHGADGDDVEVRVPVGTQVFEGDDLIADLAHPSARVVLAKAGRGGRGNARFVSPTRQVPRFAEVGMPGEERDLELHLKLLADAALVGLPNAGKSSLLTRISNARPKVAEYPFTTLQPVLGTVEAPDGRQMVVADVPGLIEGASEGIGLGHEFLAHLERARILVHVIDASKPVEEQWETIDGELAAYGAGLDERPQIVVLNKADLVPDTPTFAVEDERVIAVFALSCATGQGLDDFQWRLFALVPEPEVESVADDELPEFLVYRPEPKARGWRLFRTDRGFRVVGTPPSEEELERALRAAGARNGVEVEVGEESFELAPLSSLGLFGGSFDPPHDGHVALLRTAKSALGLDRALVLVAAEPGHKRIATPAGTRLELARAAFPDDDVLLDDHARTVDLLRAHPEWDDPVFLVGADAFVGFPGWKEPAEVLRRARLGVATRPGYPRERLDESLAGLGAPERVLFFELEPHAVSSHELRAALARGDEVTGIPPAVRRIVERDGLYAGPGYSEGT